MGPAIFCLHEKVVALWARGVFNNRWQHQAAAETVARARRVACRLPNLIILRMNL